MINVIRLTIEVIESLFLLDVISYGGGFHHMNTYTDNVRGGYSPPFVNVTKDLWSILILYIDSRFLYV